MEEGCHDPGQVLVVRSGRGRWSVPWRVRVALVLENLGDSVSEVKSTYGHLWQDAEDRTRRAAANGLAELFRNDEAGKEAR